MQVRARGKVTIKRLASK